tara:strand:+ start:1077 stop:2039 length:963 start_codon:yes stop_codon:yes gene_type:complete
MKHKGNRNVTSEFDELPEWAEQFNFTAHSPSGSARPNCKEFFEKVIARPARLYAPPGCRMTAGKVCEAYAKDVVIDGMAEGEAFRKAVATFDEHRVLEHDPSDADRHSIYRDAVYEIPLTKEEKADGVVPISGTVLELTCKHTAEGLKEATKGANQVEDGRWVSVQLDGVELDFIGEIDVEAQGVVEIKTKWPTLSDKSKRGWNVNSLPAKPMPNHLAQVALYWKWLREQSDNVPVKLIYANCKGFRIFDSRDCPELSEANLDLALDGLRRVASARENLMRASENVEELFNLIAPDFSHFMWQDVPPEYRQAAEQQWRRS